MICTSEITKPFVMIGSSTFTTISHPDSHNDRHDFQRDVLSQIFLHVSLPPFQQISAYRLSATFYSGAETSTSRSCLLLEPPLDNSPPLATEILSCSLRNNDRKRICSFTDSNTCTMSGSKLFTQFHIVRQWKITGCSNNTISLLRSLHRHEWCIVFKKY